MTLRRTLIEECPGVLGESPNNKLVKEEQITETGSPPKALLCAWNGPGGILFGGVKIAAMDRIGGFGRTKTWPTRACRCAKETKGQR